MADAGLEEIPEGTFSYDSNFRRLRVDQSSFTLRYGAMGVS